MRINANVKKFGCFRTFAGHCKTEPCGMLELWERVENELDKITPEMCMKLIETMPERIAAVLKAKGGYTKY